jgi:hypothetical protein
MLNHVVKLRDGLRRVQGESLGRLGGLRDEAV